MGTILATAANVAWCLASLPAHAAFRSALSDPRRAQLQLLRRYVRDNANTAFGREHHFEQIDGFDAFRRRVPVRDYDGHACWIDRVAAGEINVLTAERVVRLVPSSGSTRAAKLIPYTASLQAEFNRAIGPWIVDLYRRVPDVMRGCAYWSVTPVAQAAPHDDARVKLPVGFDDDSAYLGGGRRRLIDAVMAVPGDVRHAADMAAFRRATLGRLLRRRDLRLVSVWHPSFFELLLDAAEREWDALLEDVRRADPARCAELRAIGPGDWRATWPRLRVVSCWADAHASGPAAGLARRLPHVELQPKGLLATEAFVAMPFAGHWPLAVRSHVLEFEDDAGRAWGADELRVGGEYAVVVTTGGGLWRYRLGDRVRCDARLGRTPSVRFVGRQDLVVDRFGEKLSDGFVGRAIRDVLDAAGVAARFAMLAPEAPTKGEPSHYTLFIETPPPAPTDLADRLDRALSTNPHYAYCRALGQLGPARVFAIRGDAYPAYAARRQAQGRRIGDLKPVALDAATDWASVFESR